ncbi:class I SAM-dependent methyltransferase [Candidatus Pacearchaeota archaeon]|nr:class I SAM-dependent methyltransferase [Candidatus Pacearchaeota archaeon]
MAIQKKATDKERYIETYSRKSLDQLVKSIFKQRLTKKSRILELGSGRGILARLMNSEGYQIKESDVDPRVVRLRRGSGLWDNTTIEVVDAHNIPYPDSYFDAVVGINFLDLPKDLDRVCKEMSRVISLYRPQSMNSKTAGLIILINDEGFRGDNIFKDYLTPETIPFPKFNELSTVDGIVLVKRKDLEHIANKLKEVPKLLFSNITPQEFFLEYIKDPLSMVGYQACSSLLDRFQNSFSLSNHLEIQKVILSENIDCETIDCENILCQRLYQNLVDNNLEILEFGKRESLYTVEIYPVELTLVYDSPTDSYKVPSNAKMLISDGTEHFVDSLDERFGEFDKAKLFPVLKKTFVAIARKVKE